MAITTLAAVPPLWVQLAELDWPEAARASLRRLTNSGGALTPDLVRRLRALFPAARLFAMYGLTEAFRSTYPRSRADRQPPDLDGQGDPACRNPGHRRRSGDLPPMARRANWSIAGRWWRKAIGRMRNALPSVSSPRQRLALWRHGGMVGRPGEARWRRPALFRRAARCDDQDRRATGSARRRSRRPRWRPGWWPKRWRWACR